MVLVQTADREDLPAILSLQKLAYQSEAQLVNDFTIQPLTQTLDELREEFASGVVLKAVDEETPNEVIGSVRGKVSDGTLYVGKLIVHPSRQNQGLGTRLLRELESLYPHLRYELFTSTKSMKNLYIYTKNGYLEFRREELSDNLALVFLEKPSKERT